MNKIAIYVDEGAGPQSVRCLVKALREEGYQHNYIIERINRDTVRSGSWEKETALLIFPGGRDVYYHEALKGFPNQRIRSYVENGGSYLGLCAGGYYGCGSIEFEKGYPLEVVGDRELQFFPGIARGSVYGPDRFRYEDESGSCVAELEWEKNIRSAIYFNGGCEFVDASKYDNTTVLAHFMDIPGNPAAIVQCEVGRGRAILSGVHPEFGSHHLEAMKTVNPSLLSRLKAFEHIRKQMFRSLLNSLLPKEARKSLPFRYGDESSKNF